MVQHKSHRSGGFSFDPRQLLFLVLAIVASYIIVPQIGNFQHSLTLLAQSGHANLFLAIGFMVLTYFAAAGTYGWLALHHLLYCRTLLIQVAGMFINRLLPAGIGGIGVNYVYLRKARHTAAQAASVVAVNNSLGIIGHGLLLVVLLAFYHQNLPSLHLQQLRNTWFVLLAALAILAVWAALYYRFGSRLRHSLQGFVQQLLAYRRHSSRLLAALFCSMSLTLCNVLCLWFCVQATQTDLSFMAVFLIFTFGIALGTATPTPGGLGGVEAGLVGGLVAYHVDSATALAAVLLFRLITYWLPLIGGGIAFIFAEKREYI